MKRVIEDNQPGVKVFYWADTGPVETRISNNRIVEAKLVEGPADAAEAIISTWSAE